MQPRKIACGKFYCWYKHTALLKIHTKPSTNNEQTWYDTNYYYTTLAFLVKIYVLRQLDNVLLWEEDMLLHNERLSMPHQM